MPLSKKKNRDRMRTARATCVQPMAYGADPWGGVHHEVATLKLVQPSVIPKVDTVIPNIVDDVKRLYPDGMLPNCKDGRYRS